MANGFPPSGVGLKLFYEVEVEGFAEEVGFGYAYAYAVAYGEAVVGLASYEAVVFLVEVEWFVAEETHVDESFALVVVDFGKYSGFGYSAYLGVEFFSYLVAEELYLLVLDAGSFG